jgi:hypothetical protein
MKLFLTLAFVFLLAGCTESNIKPQPAAKPSDGRVFWVTPERIVDASEEAIWLQTCVSKLASIEAGDAVFIPKVDPTEEIFQKCESVEPLSTDKASIYKKWLKKRISEIQSITAGTTRKELSKILRQNGGISTPDAATYSHIESPELKVRIEFELVSYEHSKFISNENDKVKTISMPYLGFFTCD